MLKTKSARALTSSQIEAARRVVHQDNEPQKHKVPDVLVYVQDGRTLHRPILVVPVAVLAAALAGGYGHPGSVERHCVQPKHPTTPP